MTYLEWQDKFIEQPEIFWVEIKIDGEYESTGNFYDSRISAAKEVDFHRKNKRYAVIKSAHIHNQELSDVRWNQQNYTDET